MNIDFESWEEVDGPSICDGCWVKLKTKNYSFCNSEKIWTEFTVGDYSWEVIRSIQFEVSKVFPDGTFMLTRDKTTLYKPDDWVVV